MSEIAGRESAQQGLAGRAFAGRNIEKKREKRERDTARERDLSHQSWTLARLVCPLGCAALKGRNSCWDLRALTLTFSSAFQTIRHKMARLKFLAQNVQIGKRNVEAVLAVLGGGNCRPSFPGESVLTTV